MIEDEPTLSGVVTYLKRTPTGFWGFICPDGVTDQNGHIWFCADAVQGEAPDKYDRVSFIRHRYPPKPPKTTWSAYRMWREQ